jgi:hypothetical protein
MLPGVTANSRDVFADFVQMPAVSHQREKNSEQQEFDHQPAPSLRFSGPTA